MVRPLAAELQSQADALRRLARALVGDQHADDLVQETWLAALRERVRPRALRGWLYAVLRRLAHKHRRGERRRLLREAAAPVPSPAPAPDHTAEHRDTLQRLTAALLALPEPYRDVLLLRYLEDLPPSAIAQRTLLPVATVKTRLRRALALLRERLGSEGGDWRAAFGSAFGLRLVATTTGALLMGTGVKLAIGGAAAAIAVAAILWNVGAPPRAATAADATAAVAPAQAAAATPAAKPPVPASAPADAPQREPAPAPAAVDSQLATIRGRCVDERGQPIAAVSTRLHGWPADNERLGAWTRDHELPANLSAEHTTTADGRFEFRFAPIPPFQYMVLLEATGRVRVDARWSAIQPGASTDVGDALLPVGTRMRGTVRDTRGAPVTEGHVGIRSPQRQGLLLPQGSDDAAIGADGSFAMRSLLAAGAWSIEIAGRRIVHPSRVQLDGSPVVWVDVVVEHAAAPRADAELAGEVVDDRGGPVRDAHVMTEQSSPVSTDTRGRFRIARQSAPGDPVHLRVEADGCDDLRTDEAIAWGRSDLRLVVRRGLAVAITVVAADDQAPVEDFQVRVVHAPRGGTDGRGEDARAPGHHPGGTAVVDGVPRGRNFVLVEPKGDRLATSAFVPVDVADPGPALVTVALPRLVERRMRVQFADGTPVAGTRVQLADARGAEVAATTLVLPLARFGWSDGRAVLLHEAVTDGRGEALLRGPAGRALALFARGPGHVPLALQEVVLSDDAPLVVTVGRGGRVLGNVGPAEVIAELRRLAGLPEHGRLDESQRHLLPYIELRRTESSRQLHFPDSSARLDPARVADDGGYVLDGVPPGRWEVWMCWWEDAEDHSRATSASDLAARVDLQEGVATSRDLDLSFLLPGDLDAAVVCNGEPVADGWLVVSCTLDPDPLGREREYGRNVRTDAQGKVHLRTRHGEYRFQIKRDGVLLRAPQTATVVAGQTTSTTIEFACGTLRLHVLDARGEPVAGVHVDLDDPGDPVRHWSPREPTDAQGWTSAVVEVRPLVASVLTRRRQEAAAQRLVLGRVAARAGASTDVDLRLPPEWDR
jgi:RNA polymerase sigma-70 factor (ECF subfamily)